MDINLKAFEDAILLAKADLADAKLPREARALAEYRITLARAASCSGDLRRATKLLRMAQRIITGRDFWTPIRTLEKE
jgi:hypothetical protein